LHRTNRAKTAARPPRIFIQTIKATAVFAVFSVCQRQLCVEPNPFGGYNKINPIRLSWRADAHTEHRHTIAAIRKEKQI
jgi:hypothetical protein